MSVGIVGRKAGMTRIFDEEGVSIPVTVIEVENNRITQVKNEQTDGYRALQITWGTRRASRVNKSAVGHFAKAGVEAGREMREFRLGNGDGDEFEVGQEIKVSRFQAGQKVDVSGTSKGKGFAGVVKRHH